MKTDENKKQKHKQTKTHTPKPFATKLFVIVVLKSTPFHATQIYSIQF